MAGVTTFRSTLSRAAPGALAGLLAAFTALALAELVAGLVRPTAGPVTVVGGAVIDRTPAAVKDFAIRTFGEDDKAVLQLGILVVLAFIAMGLGVPSLRHRRAGAAGVLLFGVVGALAALTRPDSIGVGDALPSVAGGVAGALTLWFLASKASHRPAGGEGGGAGAGWNRRGFLTAAAATPSRPRPRVRSAGSSSTGRAKAPSPPATHSYCRNPPPRRPPFRQGPS